MLVTVALLPVAAGAPVLWSEDTDPSTRDTVLAMEGASGTFDPADAVGADLGDPDAVIQRLAETLAAVRAFETKLDGELVIMADLQAALDQVEVLRDAADRDAVFKALAYQGFAVDRYFADTLATDDEATSWRAELEDQAVVRPWRDAVAVHPSREATPYDISEAPQRVAFNALRTRLNDALPGAVRA